MRSSSAGRVVIAVCTTVVLTGCARPVTVVDPGAPGGGGASGGASAGPTGGRARDSVTLDRAAAVYVSVLRRFMTSGENSFGGSRFPKIYVLSVAVASDPMGGSRDTGVPIAGEVQRQVVDTIGTGLGAPIVFVADRDDVVVVKNGCAEVKDGGMLITFGPVPAAGDRVEIAVNGFVACLGAIWLTYVVQQRSGEWVVTSTTGSMAVA